MKVSSNYLLLVSSLLSGVLSQNFTHGNYTPEAINDYYTGNFFVPPPYRQEFIEHLDSIEVEYHEYFSQLSPTDGKPVIVSPCLSKDTVITGRKPLSFRKLKGWLKHKIDDILGRPPKLPVFKNFCAATDLDIRVYYHVVSSNLANFQQVTPTMIEAQNIILNNAYHTMSIHFTQQDLSYRINPVFASHQLNNKRVESTLSRHRYFTRSGDYWDLNVWIVEDATALNDDGTVGMLNGYADFPDATKTAILKGFDGVVIRWGTLPGTNEIYQGKTLVHEIGHWLGLRHVFDETQMNLKVTSPCIDSNSDEITDTKQYPAGKEKWDSYQIPCGENASELVTNYMSYSTSRGNGIGFKTGQKARAFSKYLGVRKGLLNQQDCNVSPTKKRGIESLLPNDILEQLQQANADCASEWNTPIVDISLQAPPDPKNPYYPVIPLDPTKPPVQLPFDPATLPKPAGSQCGADPKTGIGNPVVVPNKPTCPNPCNVHSNNCHRPTAQTCIYPDPFAPNPRAACACRPGMRALADPLDTTKHWRLPIKGLEGYVWVAEGVECGTPCNTPTGVDICREVAVLDKICIG